MPDELTDALKDKAKEIADALVSSVKTRAEDFLEENKDAREFLEERAKRLGILAVRYTIEQDPDAKVMLKDDMEIVQQTLENDISALALKASTASKELFKNILGAAFDALVKALPAIVAVL